MLDPRAGIRKAGAMPPLMALLREVVEVGARCPCCPQPGGCLVQTRCCACDSGSVNLKQNPKGSSQGSQ